MYIISDTVSSIQTNEQFETYKATLRKLQQAQTAIRKEVDAYEAAAAERAGNLTVRYLQQYLTGLIAEAHGEGTAPYKETLPVGLSGFTLGYNGEKMAVCRYAYNITRDQMLASLASAVETYSDATGGMYGASHLVYISTSATTSTKGLVPLTLEDLNSLVTGDYSHLALTVEGHSIPIPPEVAQQVSAGRYSIQVIY